MCYNTPAKKNIKRRIPMKAAKRTLSILLALLMLAAVLLSSVIDQLVPKVSSPLIQIGLGLLIALFAPSQINITLDPDLFLVLFIGPLLFDEAKNVD